MYVYAGFASDPDGTKSVSSCRKLAKNFYITINESIEEKNRDYNKCNGVS